MPYQYTILNNAKELDQETGWYYYGARYYDPQVSTWLSVDPLAEKYPAFSPYNFTMNNPVRFIDPTGMGPDDPPKKKEKVNKTAGTAVGDNVTNELDSVVITLKKAKKNNKSYSKHSNYSRFSTTNLFQQEVNMLSLYVGHKYRDGRYVQTNGKIGNFNSKPFKRLSRRAKMYKRFVQDVNKIKRVATVVQGAVIFYDVADDGNLKTSNAINGTLTAIAIFFPASAPFIGVYFAADFIFNFDETIDNHSNGIQIFENGLQIFENEK